MKKRVLVVDDSSFMRKVLTDIVDSMRGFEVVGTAVDGLEAEEMARSLKPNIITMDIQMPKIDGLEAVMKIMSFHPVPIIMVSGMDQISRDITTDALLVGAVDFVSKPEGFISSSLDSFSKQIKEKLMAASEMRVGKLKDLSEALKVIDRQRKSLSLPKESLKGCVVIASSTGGPKTLFNILTKLNNRYPVAYIFVQHMPPKFTRSFAERLNMHSLINIKEAEEGDPLMSGYGYVASGGHHLVVEKEGKGLVLRFDESERIHGVRPAADITLRSVADIFDRKCLSVILTGMGRDGTAGSVYIKEKRGNVIAQDEETSVIYGMPRAVCEAGAADQILPRDSIPEAIENIIKEW